MSESGSGIWPICPTGRKNNMPRSASLFHSFSIPLRQILEAQLFSAPGKSSLAARLPWPAPSVPGTAGVRGSLRTSLQCLSAASESKSRSLGQDLVVGDPFIEEDRRVLAMFRLRRRNPHRWSRFAEEPGPGTTFFANRLQLKRRPQGTARGRVATLRKSAKRLTEF